MQQKVHYETSANNPKSYKNLHGTHKVNPDRANVAVRILVLLPQRTPVNTTSGAQQGRSAHHKSREEARLANTRVTN
jgi:hypothetical protein